MPHWPFFSLLTPAFQRTGAAAEDRPLGRNKAVIIRLDGVIMPFTQAYLERKLNEAKKDAVDIVILEIDSPGGELEASLRYRQDAERGGLGRDGGLRARQRHVRGPERGGLCRTRM